MLLKKEIPKKISEYSLQSFTNNFYMLKLIWEICPLRVILTFFDELMNFAEWTFFTIVFMKYLFGAEEIGRSFEEILFFIICTIIVILLISIFSSWFNQRYKLITDQKIFYHLNLKIFDKATTVDISCYENPEFFDSYTKAIKEVFTRAKSVLHNMSIVVSACLSSIYVIYTMFNINVWAGFFCFLPVIGNFSLGKISNKLNYKRDMDNIPYKRRQDYVNRAVYLQKFSKEIRLTNIFNVLDNTYETAYNGVIKNCEKHWKNIFIIDSIKNIACFPLVFEGLWLFAAYSAMVSKTLLIGDFVVLSGAIVSTTWMLIHLTDSVVESYKNGLYINNLKTFLNYEEKILEDQEGIPIDPYINTLELRNVSFKYQGQDNYVLENVNIKINCGQKISLVGHNGAGKTTLVKLIMRLYDPTEGEILLNGKNIKEYNVKEYRNLIGTTFQDFQIFSMNVAENVMMSKIETNHQKEEALEALKESGVYNKIASLPNKADTILTREFDDKGIVLSGGEAQKVAVARAFVKNCPIVILDEPSSALDPIAEYEMYETIMKLCDSAKNKQKKLSIMISHRLSSATMADYIYLLENGKIIEEGPHKMLIKKDGAYADMFIKQAESYLQEVACHEE